MVVSAYRLQDGKSRMIYRVIFLIYVPILKDIFQALNQYEEYGDSSLLYFMEALCFISYELAGYIMSIL